MTRYYCMKGCGQTYCTSDRSPALPRGVGMGQGCPHHGWTTPPDHAINTPEGATRVCPKCGLHMNSSMTHQSPKFNGGPWAIRCIDCNHPTIDYAGSGNLEYCIRCGRAYDGRYARKNASGGYMIKCYKCGGNTRFFAHL